ncbi:Calx-beta domain-containing protein [Chitinophaga pinensis]|uniref:Conserved repeat domain protein n=1 Tax=Chitinophaga pinensis (strain ATCC 43595 / DSM 2588 / LMG 13176 / NBRC 15968 / NCIMB 11800 / UQM 2034) TaxID=485918 RepID=A0A979GXL7_CHIPD|nr:Calx-beta domain-containing protein [Chitinophaga pinensis]ACU62526.1 conserved repeat domain protein [Chitinophaga pinensis DSM 2588]
MIRLLFTFLLVAFLSPLAIAQTCNKDLALGKAVTTSSVTAGNIPTRATDGDPTSRWESAWSNNQWIMVDLGQSYPICTITLNWQVLATGYTVEVSPDGTSWTNLVTETANAGLNKTYSVSANGRYVRMTGLTRGSAYGFSLYDFIVIGTEPINYCSNTNVAQLRPVTVSSVVNGNTGNFAVDNNMGTRWESAHSDNQSMYVDLGANYDLCRVVLNWEAAYGRDYTIDISSNGTAWTTVKTVTGNYMRDNTLDVSGNARYVRMTGQTRGSTYGFSLWEFSVYALLPAVSVTKVTDAAEPGTGGSFRFSLPSGITFTEDITVNYSTSGTASSGTDYTALAGSVVIPAGQAGVNVPLTVIDDQIIEGNETVIATITNAISTTRPGFPISATDPSATMTITDNDNIAANKILSIAPGGNGAEPSTNGSYTISLPAGVTSAQSITVNYTTSGTATAGADYTLPATFTLPAGQNSATVTLTVSNDQIIEGTETSTVTITGGTTATLGAFTANLSNATASVNILDDDNNWTNKSIRIARTAHAAEPSTNGGFRIYLPTGITASEDVTVTAGVTGTATPGTDYVVLGSTFVIPAGQNSVAVPVQVIDDNEIESTETVTVSPTAASSATLGGFAIVFGTTANINIADNDDIPANRRLSVTKTIDAMEGASNGNFRISLPAGVSYPAAITVNYTISGTAVGGTDYTAIPATATIPAGQNGVDVAVTAQPYNNNIIENDRTVIMTLTGGSAPSFSAFTPDPANTAATVIIADDDSNATNKRLSVYNIGMDAAEPSTAGAFQIRLPGTLRASEPITVSYTITPSSSAGTTSATPGTDFNNLTGTVVIPAGQNAVNVPYSPIDDQIIETREEFTVQLTGGTTPTLGAFGVDVATGVMAIDDNDNIPANKTFTITPTAPAAESSTNGSFSVSLPAGYTVSQNVTFYYTVGGTATPGSDYTGIGTSVILTAGQNSVQITVPVIDDNIIEGTESIDVTATSGASADITGFTSSGTATNTIADDDNTATNKVISIIAANNGAEPATDATFTISLPAGITSATPVTVNFSVSGTATSGADYTALATSIVIPANQNSVTLTVPVLDDQAIEGTETVIVTVTGGTAPLAGTFTASTTNATATVNIADDDNTPANRVISIVNANNGSEPATNGAFTINLPTGVTLTEDVTVNFSVAGTATPGNDYTSPGTSTIIPAGQNSVTLTVHVLDDQLIETTETVIVTITGGSATTAGTFIAGTSNVATVDITDNDNTPANKTISITTANDGSEPSSNGAFNVSLPTGITNTEDITVNFTVAGTATAGTDYTGLGTSVTIPAGQNSVTLTVPILDDQLIEGTETVIVTVTGGSATAAGAFSASATNATATVNINDDDNNAANKVISIVAANDGSEPAINAAFTISLPTGVTVNEPVTVNFTVAGSATSSTDYTAIGTSIIIPAGQNNVTLTVPVLDDQLIEGTETVIVTVTGGAATAAGVFAASTTNAAATVNISDNDDVAANKVISIATDNDGTEPGTAGAFTISLPAGITAAEPITVNFTVAGTATAGTDYTAFGTSTIIPAGQNSVTLTVTVLDDQIIESTETVIVTVTGGTATTAGAFTAGTSNTATVNINDNDNTTTNKVITIAAANDGTEPGTNAAFTVSLPAGVTVDEDVTVNFSVAGTATAGTDYTAIGTAVMILAGQNSATLAVPVLDDQEIEATETVIVTVTGGAATNAGAFTASIANATATVNINDDDNTAANKVISITTANNGDEPSNNGAFTISLPTGITVNEDVTVNFTVTGTATAGTDYTALGTSIIIPAGQNSVTLTVPVLDDQIIEGTEAVTVTITGAAATNAGAFTAGTNNVATVNINDDDNTAINKVISIAAANDGTEPATNAAFTISLPAGVTVNEDVTVNFTVAGTATSGADYTTIGTSATILAGQNSVILTVPVLDDQIIEAAETVILTVTGGAATNTGAFTANLINATATVNINDDDNTATNKVLSIAAANDGTEPGNNAAFTVSLPTGVTVDEDVTVNFSLAGTATAGTDYTAIGSAVTILAGQNSATLTVPVLDDQEIEATETVIVTVTGGSATNAGAFTASVTNTTATVNISDDDNTAANKVISITTANNGDEPSNNGAFTVSLPTGITVNEDVTVNFTVTGTATAGTDYTALGTSIIIPAGQNSVTLAVPVLDDQIIEGTESVTVTITGGSATAAGAFTAGTNNVATVNINDDDNTATNKVISIAAANDGTEPATNAAFTISLPAGITVNEDLSVNFTIAGTATSGADYTPIGTTATILAGQNSLTLTVPVLDDQIIEAAETVILTIIDGTATVAGTFTAGTANTATVNINDNDNTAANKIISIAAANDGAEPAGNAAFTISLPTGVTVDEDLTVNFTVAGTATAGTDYISLGTSIVIPAGQNSVTLNVPIQDDQVIEATETVIVTVTGGSATNAGAFTASATNSTATINIIDNDNTAANKVISIVAANDGSEPATNAAFTVSLPTGVTSDEVVTVNFTVAGTATAGTDYTALGTSIIIPAGQNSVMLTVPVLDDQIIESTETVTVTITAGAATNAGAFTAGTSNTATVNISDDDNIPSNKVISITAANDGAEPASNAAFTISLPTGVTANEAVTVNFTVAGTATAGTDYTTLGTSVIIPAGQNSVSLNVPVLDDQVIEATETVIVTVTGGSATAAGAFTASATNATSTVDITDNDNTAANKVISITRTADGSEPSSNGAFSISLPAGVSISEDLNIIYNIAGSAINGTDYGALNGTIILPAGQNSISLPVIVTDDDIIEGAESVVVSIANAAATTITGFTVSITNSSATVIIADEDNTTANRVISINPVTNGSEPATNGSFAVSLPTGITAAEDITVNYIVAGTATVGTDYTALGTSIIIPAGQNSVTLTVPVLDDQIIEATETVIVTVTGGTTISIGAFTASATNATTTVNINDNDNTPANKVISIVAANDGAEPSTNGAFTISLPTGVTVNEAVTVNFTTAGTATAGPDYTTLATTITIPAGQNSVTLSVPVLDDQIIESAETVIATITGGTATAAGTFTASATNATATINITDNDNTAANKVISIVAVNDGAEPSTNGAFTISLPAGVSVDEDVTVNFTVIGTATAGADYTALGASVIIPAGQNSITLAVPVRDDQAIEATETVIVTITSGTAANAGAFTAGTNNTATVNISDDDNTPANKVISIVAANDGAEPSTNGAFTISLPTGVSVNEDVTVNFTVAGTATAGADYSSLGTTVIIPAGQNSAILTVPVLDDQVIESTETVIVTVTGGTGITTGAFTVSTSDASAAANISDDDNTVANRIMNVINTNDGSEPATNGNFSISLPAGIITAEDIIVSYTLAGTATTVTDYTTSGTNVTIPAGQNSVTLPIVVNDDLLMEGDETVVITITGGMTATLGTYTPGTASATLIIADDENTVTNKVLSISRNADAAEPATNGSFTVSLPAGISATENISVSYTISGTATAGTDYATLSGSVIIPAGQNSANIDMMVNDDQLIEGNETVIATITGGTGAALGTFTVSMTNNTATVTISDDDNTAANTTISITTLNDAAEPGTTGNFTISLPTGITAVEDITVTYNTSGTATPGIDYATLTGSLIIPAGQNSVTLPVTVIDDGLMEGTETVMVNLSGASAATLGTLTISTTNAQATVNINDDDNSVVRFETWKTAALPAGNTDGKIGQGEQITYTIFIRNTGNINIPRLSVQDPVPAYTSYVSGGALIGNNVHFSIVDLQPNAVSQVSFIVQTYDNLNGVQQITNVAQISDGTTTLNTLACDPSDPNCTGSNQTIVPVREPQGDLVISKSAVNQPTNGQHYILGENITYEIVVSNVGEKTFTNIAITDSLPASLDMPTYYISSKGSIIASPAAKKVVTSVDQLLPGEDVTITITCRVNNKEIINTAYVQADETETDLSNNTAVATAAASIKDLAFINAFRPGNGANNRFVIVGLEKYPGSKLLVYNRWGSLVYQSNDYKNDWRALDLPMGGYIYVAEVKKPEGVVVYKGDFIIIR